MSDIVIADHPAGAEDPWVPTNLEHPPVPPTVGSSGSGSGGSGGVAPGHGSPEGVVTADPGTTYLDLDTNGVWIKATGTGNTGWSQIIGP